VDMETIAYAKRFRRIGTISALAGPVLAVSLAAGGLVPRTWYLAAVALGLGAVPLLVFAARNRPVCQQCSGGMRVAVGYPRLIYRCRQCGERVHTGLHADY
jgi:tRNA(Ile2) C34 agmatinyltransferase TiaS